MAEKPRPSEEDDSYCDMLYFDKLKEACHSAFDEDSEEVAEDIVELDDSFWGNPDFLIPIAGGEYTEDELESRTALMPNGEKILRDAGVSFYYVHPGDSLSSIKSNLALYPEFAYLSDIKHSSSISGFNVPAGKLQADSWLPIPLAPSERVIEEVDFVAYCHAALSDLALHEEYASGLKTILQEVSVGELVASMLAVAKVEAGGKELGQFSYHRYESHKNAFSYSIFHILDSSEGLIARKKLDMTIGQSYHPQNAAKLFMAFLCEKSLGYPGKFFPLDENSEKFATFYNGNWQSRNKDYPGDLEDYYFESRARLEGVNFPELDLSDVALPPHVLDAKRKIETTSIDVLWAGDSLIYYPPRADDWTFYDLLIESNFGNSRAAGLMDTTFMKSDKTIQAFEKCLIRELDPDSPGRSDKMAVGKDDNGVFVVVVKGRTSKKIYYS